MYTSLRRLKPSGGLTSYRRYLAGRAVECFFRAGLRTENPTPHVHGLARSVASGL